MEEIVKLSRQQAAILTALRDAGPQGALNTTLNQIAFRYGARIWELGRKGFGVRCHAVNPATGLYRYILVDEHGVKVTTPSPALPGGQETGERESVGTQAELFTVTNTAYGQETKP